MGKQELDVSATSDCTRRDFSRLALAAFGGILAAMNKQESAEADDTEKAQQDDKKDETKKDEETKQAETKAPPKKKVVKREIHVCRGLNGCKGHGLPMDFNGDGKLDLNECAGQGACATARYITCNGHNDCKRQGGCGELPGENACRGRGRCNVPLRPDIWKIARARFEARMKKAKVKFGNPPPKEKTPHGRMR